MGVAFGSFKGLLGTQNQIFFFIIIIILLEIDLEGIEMAFKRSKMHRTPIFG